MAGVKKLFASVRAIVDGSNRVIFDADGSFIENKVTEERIACEEERRDFHDGDAGRVPGG